MNEPDKPSQIDLFLWNNEHNIIIRFEAEGNASLYSLLLFRWQSFQDSYFNNNGDKIFDFLFQKSTAERIYTFKPYIISGRKGERRKIKIEKKRNNQ